MATTMTPWGYDIDGDLQPIIDIDTFHAVTGRAFADDRRIEDAIAFASANVRGWCGWHVVGSLPCTATIDGGERIVWLPSTCVTSVERVEVLGEDVTSRCQWSRRGELRLPYSPDALQAVSVEYTAGFPKAPDDVAGVVVHRVIHMCSLPYGIVQQTIGSTSMQFDSKAADGIGLAYFTDSDKRGLSAYRLEEAR